MSRHLLRNVLPQEACVVPEAVRICLGGPADRVQVRGALKFMAHTPEQH